MDREAVQDGNSREKVSLTQGQRRLSELVGFRLAWQVGKERSKLARKGLQKKISSPLLSNTVKKMENTALTFLKALILHLCFPFFMGG